MQNDTTDQSADVFRLLLRDLVAERHGIIQDTAYAVAQRGAGANNSVDVAAGGIIVPGTEAGLQGYYYIVNDATVNLPMATAADAALPRIDAVIVRARDSFYSGADNDAGLVYVPGTAAASPVEPDLVALGYKNYYKLATISVPANDNTIVTGDITDTRLTGTQGRASAVGGIIVCTSSTKPSLPRTGQAIYETDLKRLTINEGTPAAPSWVTYAVPGSGSWTTYTPTFANVTLGTGGTSYGRYFRMGSLVIGVMGFTLGTGTGDVTGLITGSLPGPYPASTAGGSSMTYIGVGRAWDASAAVYWSCTAEIVPAISTTVMSNFATAGTAGWSTTVPFNWTASDSMHMFFAYETSV